MSNNLNQATAKYRTQGGPFGPENAAGSSLNKVMKLSLKGGKLCTLVELQCTDELLCELHKLMQFCQLCYMGGR